MASVDPQDITWISLTQAVGKEDWQRRIIDDLRAGRVHYRYLDTAKIRWKDKIEDLDPRTGEMIRPAGSEIVREDGSYRYDDLSEWFWVGADVNWLWSAATFAGKTIQGIEVLLPARPPATPIKTGTAGRPPVSHFVEVEAERRIESGAIVPQEGKLEDCARDLASWWEAERRHYQEPLPPLTVSAIKRVVRPLWNKALSRQKL